MLNRSTFSKLRYELLFIGLSVLVLLVIGSLPKSPPTPSVLVVPMETPSAIIQTHSQ